MTGISSQEKRIVRDSPVLLVIDLVVSGTQCIKIMSIGQFVYLSVVVYFNMILEYFSF